MERVEDFWPRHGCLTTDKTIPLIQDALKPAGRTRNCVCAKFLSILGIQDEADSCRRTWEMHNMGMRRGLLTSFGVCATYHEAEYMEDKAC